MNPLMTIVVAVKALRRNAMRTALTALGMIIGVAAVTSSSVKKLPNCAGHERMAARSALAPWICVFQLPLDATTCVRMLSPGEM